MGPQERPHPKRMWTQILHIKGRPPKLIGDNTSNSSMHSSLQCGMECPHPEVDSISLTLESVLALWCVLSNKMWHKWLCTSSGALSWRGHTASMFTLWKHWLETATEGSQPSPLKERDHMEQNQDAPDNNQHQHVREPFLEFSTHQPPS